MDRYLLVTVDTEVDRDRDWRIGDPPTFTSVVEGIPETLSPLFGRHGVRPTYLVSAEVLEDPAAVQALQSAEGAELGTHLHAEFVEPMRRVTRDRMAGMKQNTIQSQYPPEVERAKLENITKLFRAQIGWDPLSFRAGRYGMSRHTLGFLAELGYQIDSSVTPGIRWNYSEGTVDYRTWRAEPLVVPTPAGGILELPITIQASRFVDAASRLPWGADVASRLVARARPHKWLRPSRSSGRDMIRLAETLGTRYCVLMFHTVEVMPGRSPYAETRADVKRIVAALEELFMWWSDQGNAFCTMRQAAAMLLSDRR